LIQPYVFSCLEYLVVTNMHLTAPVPVSTGLVMQSVVCCVLCACHLPFSVSTAR